MAILSQKTQGSYQKKKKKANINKPNAFSQCGFGFSRCVFLSFFFFFFFAFMSFKRTKFIVYEINVTLYILFWYRLRTVYRIHSHFIKKIKIGLTILFTHLKIILL